MDLHSLDLRVDHQTEEKPQSADEEPQGEQGPAAHAEELRLAEVRQDQGGFPAVMNGRRADGRGERRDRQAQQDQQDHQTEQTSGVGTFDRHFDPLR